MNESHPIKVTGHDLGTFQGSTLASLATLFKGTLQTWPGAILKISGSMTTASKVQDRLERTLGVPEGKIEIVPGSNFLDDSVSVVIIFYKAAAPVVKPAAEQDDWKSQIGKTIVAQVEVDVTENGVQFKNQHKIPISKKRKVIWDLKFTVEQNGIREVGTDFEFFKQKLFNLAPKGSSVYLKIKMPVDVKFKEQETSMVFKEFSTKLKTGVFFKEKFGAFEVEIQVNAFAKHSFTPIPEAGSNPHQTKLGGEAMVTVTLAKW